MTRTRTMSMCVRAGRQWKDTSVARESVRDDDDDDDIGMFIHRRVDCNNTYIRS